MILYFPFDPFAESLSTRPQRTTKTTNNIIIRAAAAAAAAAAGIQERSLRGLRRQRRCGQSSRRYPCVWRAHRYDDDNMLPFGSRLFISGNTSAGNIIHVQQRLLTDLDGFFFFFFVLFSSFVPPHEALVRVVSSRKKLVLLLFISIAIDCS